MTRETLPNRRRCITTEFQHGGHSFTVTAGYRRDGRLAEIFLSNGHVGSSLEAVARDAAIIVSIALQHGANIETIRNALTKDHDGSAATILGAALDALAIGGRP